MNWIINQTKSSAIQNVSSTCIVHMLKTVENFFKGSTWALKMFDSSTKVPASVLMGNMFEFGNFEECIEVNVQEKWGSFEGHHCVAEVQFPIDKNKIFTHPSISNIPVRWSLCVPSSCSPSDLQNLLQSILPYKIMVRPELCNTGNSETFQTADWIAIYIFIMLGILCLVGTLQSLLVQDREKQNRWLSVFSWYNNGRSLISTKQSPDSLPVLHGIRFLSIVWIIIGHSYEYSSYLPQLNYFIANKMVRNWAYLIVVNGGFAVDTFMLISGLLLCYIFMKTMEKGYHFNLPIFYLHRLFRIWPVLGMVVLFQATLITKFGSGPLWKYGIINKQSKYCKDNWWSTMLFISNYVHVREMCFPVAWYLAVDMQLYWISPIFLFLLLKKPKLGIGVIIGAYFVGMGISFQQAYYHQDRASIIETRGISNDRYYYTHTRYGAWLIGLLCGYVIYKTTNWRSRVATGRDHLPKRVVICGWIFTIALLIAIIHWIYPLQQADYEYNRLQESLYLSLSHPLWALGMFWIIFACVSGYGGFINSFLTWNAMIPLSHLTFSIYVVHFILLCIGVGSTKASVYLTHLDEVILSFGYVMLSLIISIFVFLMVEMPFLGFEKIILKKAQASTKNTSLELGSETHKKYQTNIKKQ